MSLLVFVFSLVSSVRCKNGMNHLRDRVPHMADGLCQFAHQYNNKVLICKVSLMSDSLTSNFNDLVFDGCCPRHFCVVCFKLLLWLTFSFTGYSLNAAFKIIT